MITIGWIVVLGLPLAVIAWAGLRPDPSPDEHSVEAIRRRIEEEDAE